MGDCGQRSFHKSLFRCDRVTLQGGTTRDTVAQGEQCERTLVALRRPFSALSWGVQWSWGRERVTCSIVSGFRSIVKRARSICAKRLLGFPQRGIVPPEAF